MPNIDSHLFGHAHCIVLGELRPHSSEASDGSSCYVFNNRKLGYVFLSLFFNHNIAAILILIIVDLIL